MVESLLEYHSQIPDKTYVSYSLEFSKDYRPVSLWQKVSALHCELPFSGYLHKILFPHVPIIQLSLRIWNHSCTYQLRYNLKFNVSEKVSSEFPKQSSGGRFCPMGNILSFNWRIFWHVKNRWHQRACDPFVIKWPHLI